MNIDKFTRTKNIAMREPGVNEQHRLSTYLFSLCVVHIDSFVISPGCPAASLTLDDYISHTFFATSRRRELTYTRRRLRRFSIVTRFRTTGGSCIFYRRVSMSYIPGSGADSEKQSIILQIYICKYRDRGASIHRGSSGVGEPAGRLSINDADRRD